MVIWLVWKVRNDFLFEDIFSHLVTCAILCKSFLAYFSQARLSKNPRIVKPLEIKEFSIAFFDGASQDKGFFCRTSRIVFLVDNVSFAFKVGLGIGTNNFVEHSMLWIMLGLAIFLGLDKLFFPW